MPDPEIHGKRPEALCVLYIMDVSTTYLIDKRVHGPDI